MNIQLQVDDYLVERLGIDTITAKCQQYLARERKKFLANDKKNEIVSQPQRKFTAEQQEFIDGLKEALTQVELHQQGKIKLQSAREFLKELREEEI
jgi:Fic family protein